MARPNAHFLRLALSVLVSDGSDLDMYLKMKHTLTDREARTIIAQVFAGLKYLNEQKQKIIHYDLKPGNILFHEGGGQFGKRRDIAISVHAMVAHILFLLPLLSA